MFFVAKQDVIIMVFADPGGIATSPDSSINHPHEEVYYTPMHAVRKSSGTTTKICVVFNASAISSSGTGLNEQFMVGHTLHALMLDVLFLCCSGPLRRPRCIRLLIFNRNVV